LKIRLYIAFAELERVAVRVSGQVLPSPSQRCVVSVDPSFYMLDKGARVQQQLFSFGAGSDGGAGVVDLIPFAAAGIEVISKMGSRSPERQLRSLEGKAVVSVNARNAVSGAGNGHFAV
jgi:hypothetical protein